MSCIDIDFLSAGVICRGRLHLPDVEQPPLLIMANGFGTEWQFGVKDTIKAFNDAGIATFNFDYRGFGQSEGLPRQLIDIPAQLDDMRAAIAAVKDHQAIDTKRVALWGSSLGGGHALSLAAERTDLCGLVAQVPHCCSQAAFKTVSLGSVFKGIGYSIYDSLRGLLNLSPYTIPIVAEPGEYGVMNHANWKQSYFQIVNSESQWQNATPARSLARSGNYRPILTANKITVPCLLVCGDQDQGVPVDSVRNTAKKISDCRLVEYQGDHFEVYFGDQTADLIQQETAFLKQVFQLN